MTKKNLLSAPQLDQDLQDLKELSNDEFLMRSLAQNSQLTDDNSAYQMNKPKPLTTMPLSKSKKAKFVARISQLYANDLEGFDSEETDESEFNAPPCVIIHNQQANGADEDEAMVNGNEHDFVSASHNSTSSTDSTNSHVSSANSLPQVSFELDLNIDHDVDDFVLHKSQGHSLSSQDSGGHESNLSLSSPTLSSRLSSMMETEQYNIEHSIRQKEIDNTPLARILTERSSKSLISLHRGDKLPLKKELNEGFKHGTTIFPLAGYQVSNRKYSSRVSLHWHPEVELVRFTRGKFDITIDMQDITIYNDAFMLLPGNIIHTMLLPANCQESAIVFDPRMLMFQNYDEVQSETFHALISGNMPLPPIITPDHPIFNRIDELYNFCLENYKTDSASMRLIIKAKLLEILSLYHDFGLVSRKEIHTATKKTKQDKLKELLNYIDNHYAGPISIRDASSRLGVTDQYFCRFFKRVTGMSFTSYLNDVRLRRASKEIQFTNRPISEIAFEHGFENAGYFFKIFKSKFGMTPLKYRKTHS